MDATGGIRRLALRPWLVSLLLGVALGAASLVGDAIGIRLLNGLANAAGPWLVVAFAAGLGHLDLRAGAVGGALSLLAAVATYYVGIPILWGPDHAYAGPLIALWIVAAVVGGAVFGAAGSAWRGATGRARMIAGALLPAALLAEALHRLLQIEPWTGFDASGTYAQVMLAELVAGAIALWFVVRGPDRRGTSIAAAGLTMAGLATFLAVERLAGVLAFL